MRVSNFLLWQIAYCELHVTQALWPEFDDAELLRALRAYGGRERRFGKTGQQIKEASSSTSPTAHSSVKNITEGSDDTATGGFTWGKAVFILQICALRCFAARGIGSQFGKGKQSSTNYHLLHSTPQGSGRTAVTNALRYIVCTFVPICILVACLLALFFLAPLALRLGLIQSGLESHQQRHSPQNTCTSDVVSPPCAVVLLDSRVCQIANTVLKKFFHLALQAKGWLKF
jgi:hypothetical protein